MSTNNGGPAFPDARSQIGMSLRDYFAAKVMHAELNTAGANDVAAEALIDAAAVAGQTIEARVAYNAYRMADAMLAERAK